VFDARKRVRRLSLVYCGDDRKAKKVAATLIRDVGFDPIDVDPLRTGPLHRALLAGHRAARVRGARWPGDGVQVRAVWRARALISIAHPVPDWRKRTQTAANGRGGRARVPSVPSTSRLLSRACVNAPGHVPGALGTPQRKAPRRRGVESGGAGNRIPVFVRSMGSRRGHFGTSWALAMAHERPSRAQGAHNLWATRSRSRTLRRSHRRCAR
jgi:hypothetical protein